MLIPDPEPLTEEQGLAVALGGEGDATTVTLTQYNHGSKQLDDKTRKEFESTWTALLDHLKKAVEAS